MGSKFAKFSRVMHGFFIIKWKIVIFKDNKKHIRNL